MTRRKKSPIIAVPPASPAQSTNIWWLLGGVILLGSVLRIWAALDLFWLDEIWSLRYFALMAESPLDIFTTMQESNNHHLATLWMYLCGGDQHWLIYRIPSLAAGIGTILLMWSIARRWGPPAAFFALTMSAVSFVSITYSSEARGYALAGMFSLAALAVLDRHLKSPGWPTAVAFGGLTLMSFLAHLTAIFIYSGALLWSFVVMSKQSRTWPQALSAFAKCHVLGAVGLVALYLVAYRNYEVGGADPYELGQFVEQVLALAVGFSGGQGLQQSVVSILALVLGGAALYQLWRLGDDFWIFLATSTFVAPALVLLTRPSAMYERFLYPSILSYLLLVSYFLGHTFAVGSWQRVVSISMACLFVASNGLSTMQFLQYGRGDYLAALQFIAQHSSSSAISLQSDHDFRNATVLRFYSNRYLSDYQWNYTPQNAAPTGTTEWSILHGFGPEYQPHSEVVDRQGNVFRLERLFPYWGLSGFHWAVYRRESAN